MGTELTTPALDLLERSAQLSQLRDTLEGVTREGHGRLVTVAGEAGIGKTALVDAFCAGLRSARILRGACDPLVTPRALGPVVDIAAQTGGQLARTIDEGRAGITEPVGDLAPAEPFAPSLEERHEAAADVWAAVGCPYEAALALTDSSDPESVKAGLAGLRELGATAAATRAGQSIRARGLPVARGPRRPTQSNPAGLTPRELDVLMLLADGLRNAQIADRLVVSTKTVGHHVSAILRKLGVATRTEAAAHAHSLGLARDPH